MYYNILTSQKATQPHGAGGVGAVVGVCEPRVWRPGLSATWQAAVLKQEEGLHVL